MDVQGLLSSAATKYGLDPDFVTSIAKAESNFNPNAVSPKGAYGTMQLMPETAKSLGVNPRDPAQNIEGGVKYLSQLADQFNGDPVKVAAAYNAGPGRVQKFGGVPPYKETQGYVQRVMNSYNPPTVNAGRADNGHSDAFNYWVQHVGGTPAQAPGQLPQAPDPNDLPPPTPSLEELGLKPGWDKRQPTQEGMSPGAQQVRQRWSKMIAPTWTGPGAGTKGAINEALNTLALGAAPTLNAAFNAGVQGVQNFASDYLGDVPRSPTGQPLPKGQQHISMADVFQGTLAAENEAKAQFEKTHPRAALVGQIGGFISPEGAFNTVAGGVERLAGNALTRYAPQVSRTVVGKAAPALLGVGAASAGQAGVEGAQEGETLPQVGQRMAVSGATAIPMAAMGMGASGVLGRLSSKALPPSSNTLTSRMAQAVSSAAGYGSAAALTGGVTSVLNGGDFIKGAINPGITGALVGAGGELLRPHEPLNKTPDARDRARALDDLASTGVTPDTLASAHPEAVVADVAPNAQAIIRHAANYGSDVYPHVQSAMDDRQSPTAVSGRTSSDLMATGHNPETAEIRYQAKQTALQESPQSLAGLTEAKKENTAPAPTAERLRKAYVDATGVDPVTARSKADEEGDLRQEEEISPAYRAVATSEGVYSPEIEGLSVVSPTWRAAMAKAAERLHLQKRTPFVDNPAYGAQGNLTPQGAHPEVMNGVPEAVPPDMAHLGTEVPTETRQIAEDLKGDKAFRPKGKNLVTYLKSLGGINDEGGEITGIFGGKQGAPIAPKGKGVSMDRAALSAKEAGYPIGDPRLTDAGPQDLIDALDRHVRQGPLHPQTEENAAISARKAAVDRAHEQLQELGLNHQQMSVDDVASALHNHERYAAEHFAPPHQGEGLSEHASPEDYYKDREKDWEDFMAGKHREPELPPEPGQPEQPKLIKQPKVIPTKELLIRTKQEFDRLRRDNPDYRVDLRDAVIENEKLNPVLDELIPGLAEARDIAGDAISNRQSFKEGYNLHNRSAGADQAAEVASDFLTKSEGDQQKMREGYLAREQDLMENGKIRPLTHANNPFHQSIRRTLFGEDGASKIEDALKREQQLREARPEAQAIDRAHQLAHDAGTKALNATPDKLAFEKKWSEMTTDQRDAYREGLLTAINTQSKGTVDVQARLFKNLQSPGFIDHLRLVLGDEATTKLQETAAREQLFAASAKSALTAGKHGKPMAHEPPQGLKGILHMLATPQAMTPGRANALGEIMSSKANDIADELKARQALKGTKADTATAGEPFKSAISPALAGVAGLTGTRLAAFGQNGVNQ